MVSISSKILQYFLYRRGNINCLKNPNVIDNLKRGRHRKNSRYVIIKKDNGIEPKKVIFYMHGGAYIVGLISVYERYWHSFCNLRDDIEIVLMDYSVAPEHKYPTQINETIDVWFELTKTIKQENIIVGGDSAGGNLALVLINKLQKEYGLSPKGAVLFSPWTDMTLSGKSIYDNYTKDVLSGDYNHPLTKENYEIYKNSEIFSFIGDADRKDPYISPFFDDYKIFPKSLFFVGGNEMILDDTLRVVEKIKQNGNEVTLINKEEMFHVYPIFGSFTPEGKEALKIIQDFVLECFKEEN
ncbi:hypothetical protein PIROE2DRAFT_4735 [Piromyces sp. E2]|nr:hypothetical protein PIROE2DRAFT_4735 [Piromyces sp. E2]|eukprot:OUM67781.1 hypothetical protein PIROE2DRAFT_4735 [Piromyces sp. E2]